MYPFYQSQKQNYLQTAFVEEEISLERIEFKIAFAKEQLINAGSVIVDTLKIRSEMGHSDNGIGNYNLAVNQTSLLNPNAVKVKHYSLLSSDMTKSLSPISTLPPHYVLTESSQFYPAIEMLTRSKIVDSISVIADMGNYGFQAIHSKKEDISVSLMEWLNINSDKISAKGKLSDVVFTPPLANRNALENYLLVAIPVTNKKPVYLVVELNQSELMLDIESETKYVLWQKNNGRVVSSNIAIDTESSSNVQNYLLTRYVPEPWHELIFLSQQSDARYSTIDEQEYVLKIENIEHSNYFAFFFKRNEMFIDEVWRLSMIEGIKLMMFGGVGLTIIYLLIFYMFAKPISNFLNFIEQQNSLYDNQFVKKPKGWEPWFEKIALSYQDNRKLFNSLVIKNKQLDEKILQRTHELQLQTISKDRNLALNRAIINSMPDMIYYKNVDGSFVGCNKAFEKLCGVAESDLVTLTVEDIFSAETSEKLSNFDFQALKSKRLFSAKIWQKINTDDVYVNWLVAPITNADGEVLGTVGLGRDITEQEANFRQVEKARQDAEQANQAKSEFIANMSHEIRTPMNAVMGMLELLSSTAPTPLQHTYLGVAESSSRHLLQVINDILDFSKMNAGMLELNYDDVNLYDVLDVSFANSLSAAMEKGLILDIDLPIGFPVHYRADKIRLSQVLTNLINNAVKFTNEGSVTFKGRVMTQKDNEVMLCFSISDTGIGIPTNRQRIVFDAFSQADTSITRQYGGTGLGLAIVFQLVELMNGEIRLESEEGVGTSFHVILPLELSVASENKPIKKRSWVIFATNQKLEGFLLDKLNGDQQTVVKLQDTDAGVESAAGNTVLICQPALLELLPEDWRQAITEGKVEYQPIVFNLSNFTKSMLGSLPYRPILSMPFSTELLVSNEQVDNKLDEKTALCEGSHILIVEDNIVNQQVTALILDSIGATYDIAENGLVGLRLVNSNRYDAALVDIQMPVMDGLTFAKKVRSQSRFESLPLIAMTAHTYPEDKQRSMRAGMSLHINKPIERSSLIEALKTFLEFDKTANPKELPVPALVEQTNPTEVLDKENLLAQVGGNFGLMLKLLTLFKESKLDELKMLQSNVLELDSLTLFSKLHNYEGMLANIRASESVLVIQQLRTALKADDTDMITVATKNWEDSLQRLIKEINTIISQ